MFLKLVFKFFSRQKQVYLLRKNGILLGTRLRDNQKIFLYMLGDLFLEVSYPNNNISEEPVIVKAFSDIDKLNDYLEREVKVSY